MITYLNLGKKGNLGNQLFQIASTIGIAKKHGHEFCFPTWSFSRYFNFDFKEQENFNSFKWEIIQEKKFEYHDWDIHPNNNYSLNGWLQSEKYFEDLPIKQMFSFRKDFENQLIEQYENLYSKPTVLITVRRGDFVDNPNFFQISYKYYLTAILKYFSNLDSYHFVFTSDDINYCKFHFSGIKNTFFLENCSPIEQLCLATKMDHFIISNSTFSWWIAKLGEKENSLVIRPEKNFCGSLAIKYNEKDFYPDRWQLYPKKEFFIPYNYIFIVLKGEIFHIIEIAKIRRRKSWYRLKQWIKKAIRYE